MCQNVSTANSTQQKLTMNPALRLPEYERTTPTARGIAAPPKPQKPYGCSLAATGLG